MGISLNTSVVYFYKYMNSSYVICVHFASKCWLFLGNWLIYYSGNGKWAATRQFIPIKEVYHLAICIIVVMEWFCASAFTSSSLHKMAERCCNTRIYHCNMLEYGYIGYYNKISLLLRILYVQYSYQMYLKGNNPNNNNRNFIYSTYTI